MIVVKDSLNTLVCDNSSRLLYNEFTFGVLTASRGMTRKARF